MLISPLWTITMESSLFVASDSDFSMHNGSVKFPFQIMCLNKGRTKEDEETIS